VGLYAIQLAVRCGLNVITTCSPHNADLVRSYGAKYVFDYNDPKVIEEITEVAPDLQYVFDTIGNTTSSALSSRAFGDGERHLCTVRPGKVNTDQVTPNTHVTDVLVWTAFLKEHHFGRFHWPVHQALNLLLDINTNHD
jgi:NADPH:quinone reductase-like Zn-dependent oxidoreductase